MTEIIQSLLKELAINAEKSNVRAIGVAMQHQLVKEKNAANKKHKQTVETVEKSLETHRKKLEDALKGKFAKKVKETFEEQQEELKIFSQDYLV